MCLQIVALEECLVMQRSVLIEAELGHACVDMQVTRSMMMMVLVAYTSLITIWNKCLLLS